MSEEGFEKASNREKKVFQLRKSQSLILAKAGFKYDFEENKQHIIGKDKEYKRR